MTKFPILMSMVAAEAAFSLDRAASVTPTDAEHGYYGGQG